MRAKKRKKRWTWILFYQGPARKPEATPDVLTKNLTRWISEDWKCKGEARGNCRQQPPLPDCRSKDGSWRYQNIKVQTRGPGQLNQSSEQGTLLAGAGNSERWVVKLVLGRWGWSLKTAANCDCNCFGWKNRKKKKKHCWGDTQRSRKQPVGTQRKCNGSRVQLLTT